MGAKVRSTLKLWICWELGQDERQLMPGQGASYTQHSKQTLVHNNAKGQATQGISSTAGPSISPLAYIAPPPPPTPIRTSAPVNLERLDPASQPCPSPGTTRAVEASAIQNSFHPISHSQPSPGFPHSPLPTSEGSHLLLLGGSYFLSHLPTTPTQSLSQTISCSFPSDQFLRKLIIHRGRRQKSLRAKNTERKLRLHSPPSRTTLSLALSPHAPP